MESGSDILGENSIFEEIEERQVEAELSVCSNVDVTYRYQREYCDGRMSLPLMIATVVVGFITIIVNLGVIIRTIKIIRQGHDKPAFFFIGNLALSDFAIGLFVVVAFLLHVTNKSDLWKQNTCMLQIGVAVTACQETIFTIVLISVDKYLYICHGLRYSTIMTRRRVYVALILSWCVALLIGSLPAMGLHVSWPEACNRCAFAQVISTTFAIIFFITSVAVPFAVVVALYCLLLTLALRMQKARYGGSYTGDEKARSSNLRLSFMSSKRSKNSSTRTATSKVSINTTTTSSSSSKDNRRKIRRMELEKYKEELARGDDNGGGTGVSKPDGEELIGEATSSPPEGAGEARSTGEETGGVAAGGGDSNNEGTEDVTVEPVESDRNGAESSGSENDVRNEVVETKDEFWKSGKEEEEGGESNTTSLDSNLKRRTETCETVVWYNVEEEDEGGQSRTTSSVPPQAKTRTEKKRSKVWKDHSEEEDEVEEASVEENPRGIRSFFPSKYINKIVAETRDKVLFLKKCRAIKTVLLILVSFAATYVPFVVGTLVYSAEQHKSPCLLHMLNTLLYCAVVANSLVNPLIYAYGYREFRIRAEKFKGVLARKKPRPYT